MRYKVLWTSLAEDDLAAIWLAARDRINVSSSARRMDEGLALDALHQGESREGTMRIVFQPPLAAHIDVAQSEHTVHVLRVWRMDQRRPKR